MRKKKDKPMIPQSFSIWMNKDQELASKEKENNVFYWKTVDFKCCQVSETKTCKGRDMALKLWRANGEIEMGISNWERQNHFFTLIPDVIICIALIILMSLTPLDSCIKGNIYC